MGRLIVWTNAHPIKIKNAIGETLFNCGVEYKAKSLGTKIPEVEAGDVILAMGQKTLDIVQKSGMVAKNRKIGSMRGQEIKIHSGKCSIFFTYDPGLIAIDSGRKPDIQWDTQLCIRKALTGTIDPEVGVYKYVTDYTKDIEYINKMYAQTKRKVGISVDLETVGLDPWAEEVFIVSIALTVKEGHSSVIRFSSAIDPTQPAMIKLDVKKPYNKALNAELLHQIEWLMSTPKASLKGANFKFDMNWMQRHWGISDYSNYKMDTTLIGSLLDENRSNSLNNHAKTYT
ncbi:MAG: hypothetical protein KAH32_08885, partial [Chlamydiia bacterium]|nr:hypothetical protein [Chlamydiia bacterium]